LIVARVETPGTALAPPPASAIIARAAHGAFDPAARIAYAFGHLTTSKVPDQ
jgi:hypothetical protein